MDGTTTDCLYYPFSRLLYPTTLKYLLLIFDSVTFLDEVETADWRRKLLEDMRRDSPLFGTFSELADDYDMLSDGLAVKVVNPRGLHASKSQEVAMATLADLGDPKFLAIARSPQKYGLPARSSKVQGLQGVSAGGPERATWQSFRGKLAQPLLADPAFKNDSRWIPHVITPGDDHYSWTLSYEAGSACVVNHYLEAARELGVTPVTSSQLHHCLVVRKLKRLVESDEDGLALIDDEARNRCRTVLGQGEILRLLGGIFPEATLKSVSFADIVKFRNETTGQRHSFLNEITETIRVIDGDPSKAGYDRALALAIRDLKQRFAAVQSELQSARDRLLPSVAEGIMYGAAGSGALGSLATFLGGLSAGGVVAASALTVGGALATRASGVWLERRQLQRKQGPAVSYLLSLGKLAS